MCRYISFFFLLTLFISCQSKQDNTQNDSTLKRPKLVVGIVVDQMRYDYLTRFESKYGEGGFKRMMREGYNFKNHHFNYVPTYTGPGHASVFTGTTPKYHGIISNEWYDKISKTVVYCASDSTVQSVGTKSFAGQMSPHRMLTTTFADENRLFTQMRGKTIGIAIKDRGAILPAGHTANAAYWFYGKDQGHWITSSYYMNDLPQWVKDFNASEKTETYLKTWDTYFPLETYTESGPDNNDFEWGFRGKDTPTFPYDLAELAKKQGGFTKGGKINYDILKMTPFGNSLTTDFALAAIEGEELGKDNNTDVLTISFSSADYVGHNFGVNSKEVEDNYIRLDKDLEKLFNYLDTHIGQGEYTVFLTADHGAIEVPAYLQSVKIPAGYLDYNARKEKFQAFLKEKYGTTEIVENVSNQQLFLNKEKLKALKLDLHKVEQDLVDEQISYDGISKVYTATAMNSTQFTNGIEHLLQNGFNQKRSGDVIVVNDIAHIAYSKTGSTHGSGLNYDTHVPLIMMGKGIKQGSTYNKTVIPDIAPTVSALLGIAFPNGATGRVLGEVLK